MCFPSSNVSIGFRPLHIFHDGFAHYYSEPAIYQEPIIILQDYHITFCERHPIKLVQYRFMEQLADTIVLR